MNKSFINIFTFAVTYNTINNLNSEYDQNYAIEYDADDIIDFTQSNPFGEYGNKGSTI